MIAWHCMSQFNFLFGYACLIEKKARLNTFLAAVVAIFVLPSVKLHLQNDNILCVYTSNL